MNLTHLMLECCHVLSLLWHTKISDLTNSKLWTLQNFSCSLVSSIPLEYMYRCLWFNLMLSSPLSHHALPHCAGSSTCSDVFPLELGCGRLLAASMVTAPFIPGEGSVYQVKIWYAVACCTLYTNTTQLITCVTNSLFSLFVRVSVVTESESVMK